MYGNCRAADWKLDEPDWTGRLRAVSKGTEVVLKLEDSNTGNCYLLISETAVLITFSVVLESTVIEIKLLEIGFQIKIVEFCPPETVFPPD